MVTMTWTRRYPCGFSIIYKFQIYIYIWYIYISYKVLYNIPMLSPVDSPECPSWTLASVPRTSETSPGCIARATASNSWISSLENPWKSMENPWKSMENPWGIMENHGTSMEHYGKMIDKCLKSWKHYFISSSVMKIPLKSMAVFVGALDLNSIYLVYPRRVFLYMYTLEYFRSFSKGSLDIFQHFDRSHRVVKQKHKSFRRKSPPWLQV